MEKSTNELINRYKEQLSFFKNLILNTKDETFKNSYLVIAKELCILEKTDLKIYEENIKNLEIQFREPKQELESTLKEKVETKDYSESIEIPKEKKDAPLDNYVFKNIYLSKDELMKDKFQKLFLNLQDILKASDEEEIKKWVKDYKIFTDTYNSLDKNILINFMKKYFKLYDNKKVFIDKLDDYLKKVQNVETKVITEEDKKENVIIENNEKIKENNEKPLKIINIKKKHIVSLESIRVLAMIGIGATTGLGGFFTSLLIFNLTKKGFKSQKFNKLLEKHGYKIVNEELIDKDGNKVTNEKVEKEKVGFFKQKLMNLYKYKDDGMFKKSYKKNRITSMLLNMKHVDSIKKRFKFNNSEDAPIIQNEDYKKGMGKC